jgi:hypothetical protein
VNRYVAAACIVAAASTIPVSVVQTWQYKQFILHCTSIDKQKYWDVFLETEPQFKGFLWKGDYWLDERWSHTPLDSTMIGSHEIKPGMQVVVWSDTIEDWSAYAHANLLQLEFDATFNREMNSVISVRISEAGNESPHYEFGQQTMHFAMSGLNKYHRGIYNFKFQEKDLQAPVIVSVKVSTYDNPVSMRNARVRWIWYHPFGK